MKRTSRAAAAAPAAEIFTAAFRGDIERGADQAGRFTINGTANTFTPMRSGRIIMPSALDAWLADNPAVDLPILANHGGGDGPADFATIGRCTSVRADATGLRFAGWLASGTPLADQARALVDQKALRGLSVGWKETAPAEYVSARDPKLDPYLKQCMERGGLDGLTVYRQIALVELSLVDVPDDAGATLARHTDAGSADTLRADIRELRASLDALRGERELARAEFRAMIAEFWEQGQSAFMGAIESVALLAHQSPEDLAAMEELSFPVGDDGDGDASGDGNAAGDPGECGCPAHGKVGRMRGADAGDAADVSRASNLLRNWAAGKKPAADGK